MSLKSEIEALPGIMVGVVVVSRADALRIADAYDAALQALEQERDRLRAELDKVAARAMGVQPLPKCRYDSCTSTATHGPHNKASVCWSHAGDWPGVKAMPAGGEPSEKPGELPRWRMELERMHFELGAGRPILDEELFRRLCELEELRTVIESGRGEAVVPEGVAKIIWGKGCDRDPVTVIGSETGLRWRGAHAGATICDTTEWIAAIDAYGNSLCEGAK